MSNARIRLLVSTLVLLWAGFTIAAYFVSHKPVALQVLDSLTRLVWALIVTSLLTINAFALGKYILQKVYRQAESGSSIILFAGGMGLGALGIFGFGLAAIGISHQLLLLAVQIILLVFFIARGVTKQVFHDLQNLLSSFKTSAYSTLAWMRIAALTAFLLTFLRTFLPPIEAFDAMLYHLRVPELWIADRGLEAYNIPHYWFPGLVEGVNFWALGLGSEITTQQMHFLWAILLALLLWHWTRTLWNDKTAWWAMMLLVSMPSLLLLASWAYTDMALTFYSVATLYCLWRGKHSGNKDFWNLSAIIAGMAMGVKYTSFVVPVSAVMMIFIWEYKNSFQWLRSVSQFSLISITSGAIWYIRNWFWMGNPFYPFVFGGRHWDSFRATAFSGAGTGSGWDLKALLSLPLTITLGYQDANYFDGNIGPLFLLALPLMLWLYAKIKQFDSPQRIALAVIGLFVLLSASFWTFGYISTRHLWQARLLFPALIPLAIPSAVAISSLPAFDIKKFRSSFIITALTATAIYLNLLDSILLVVARNPIGVATGIVSREEYFEQFQPGLYHAMQMVSELPEDSYVYSLLEPRSYGLSHHIQPDPILDNFAHDLFLHKSPEDIVQAWRSQGYTHILLNVRGADFVYQNTNEKNDLEKTLELLSLMHTSPNGDYEIYEFP